MEVGQIAKNKVVQTVLRLKDEMSPIMLKSAKATKGLREKVEKTTSKINNLKAANAKATEGLKKQQAAMKTLTSSRNANSKAIERAYGQLNKYTSKTGLSAKQTESNNKKIREARERIAGLKKTQGDLNKSMEQARKSMEKYSESIRSNDKGISSLNKKLAGYNLKIKNNVKIQKEAQSAIDRWGKAAVKSIDKVIARTVKMGLAFGTAIAAFGIKTGFSEATNMEGYRVQIETAVKDTEKAGRLMAEAVSFANSTPFETGSVVEATAKMEAYGISSKRWLADVADMAGATNKSIDQATEAMADAVMGEWERLKEFGIKKEMLVAAAAKKYGDDVVFNKKGQVTDQIKMQEILQETMQKKFKGGAKALSKTYKGLWSTITGVTKSSLSAIVGMQADGTIRQGSMYMKLKEKMQEVVDVLLKWQSDGTITRISDNVTKSVTSMINTIKTLVNFVNEYKGAIVIIGTLVSSIYLAIKAYTAYIGILKIVTTIQTILNGTMVLNPIGLMVAAVVGLIAVCVILYKTWDIVVESIKNTWNWLKNLITTFVDITLEITGFKTVIEGVIGIFKTLSGAAGSAFDKVKSLFGLTGKGKDINIEVSDGSGGNIEIPTMEGYANGGIATKPSVFGEAGPEIAIPLNNSSRSKDLLKHANNMIGGGSGDINITFTGDVYGFDDFKERIAEAIVKIREVQRSNVVGGLI